MSGSTIVFSRGEDPLRADKLNKAFSERVIRSGDTMLGPFTLARDPVVSMEAATKQYVDNYLFGASGMFLPLTGGTLTGSLILHADPTANLQAATKSYVDSMAAMGVNSFNTRTGEVTLTNADVIAVLPSATTLPLVDGTATAGSGTTWSRADHIHPTDTSRAAASAIPIASSTLPLAPGTAAIGASTTYARADHVHPGAVSGVSSFNTRTGAVVLTTADVTTVADSTYVNVGGDTMTGPLVLAADPAAPLQAATKQYVDTNYITPAAGDTRWVNVSGDTMSGALTVADRTIISGASPRLNLYVPGAALNQKYLDLYADGAGTFSMQFVNDAFNAGGGFMSVTRSDIAPQVLTLTAPTITLNGTVDTPNNLTANQLLATNVIVSNVFSSNGLFQISPSYYMQRSPGDGAWRFVENGTTNFTIAPFGDVTARAGLFAAGINSVFGLYSGSGTRNLGYTSGWSWVFDTTTGQLIWNTPNGILLGMRLLDNLSWNNLGPMGGYGAYVVLSDERAKRDIEPATVGLKEVLDLVPISYIRVPHEHKEGATLPDGSPLPPVIHRIEIGFSAQQIASVIPAAVRVAGFTLPDGSGGIDTDDPSLGITDTTILAAVVNAIKDIDARLVAKGI